MATYTSTAETFENGNRTVSRRDTTSVAVFEVTSMSEDVLNKSYVYRSSQPISGVSAGSTVVTITEDPDDYQYALTTSDDYETFSDGITVTLNNEVSQAVCRLYCANTSVLDVGALSIANWMVTPMSFGKCLACPPNVDSNGSLVMYRYTAGNLYTTPSVGTIQDKLEPNSPAMGLTSTALRTYVFALNESDVLGNGLFLVEFDLPVGDGAAAWSINVDPGGNYGNSYRVKVEDLQATASTDSSMFFIDEDASIRKVISNTAVQCAVTTIAFNGTNPIFTTTTTAANTSYMMIMKRQVIDSQNVTRFGADTSATTLTDYGTLPITIESATITAASNDGIDYDTVVLWLLLSDGMFARVHTQTVDGTPSMVLDQTVPTSSPGYTPVSITASTIDENVLWGWCQDTNDSTKSTLGLWVFNQGTYYFYPHRKVTTADISSFHFGTSMQTIGSAVMPFGTDPMRLHNVAQTSNTVRRLSENEYVPPDNTTVLKVDSVQLDKPADATRLLPLQSFKTESTGAPPSLLLSKEAGAWSVQDVPPEWTTSGDDVLHVYPKTSDAVYADLLDKVVLEWPQATYDTTNLVQVYSFGTSVLPSISPDALIGMSVSTTGFYATLPNVTDSAGHVSVSIHRVDTGELVTTLDLTGLTASTTLKCPILLNSRAIVLVCTYENVKGLYEFNVTSESTIVTTITTNVPGAVHWDESTYGANQRVAMFVDPAQGQFTCTGMSGNSNTFNAVITGMELVKVVSNGTNVYVIANIDGETELITCDSDVTGLERTVLPAAPIAMNPGLSYVLGNTDVYAATIRLDIYSLNLAAGTWNKVTTGDDSVTATSFWSGPNADTYYAQVTGVGFVNVSASADGTTFLTEMASGEAALSTFSTIGSAEGYGVYTVEDGGVYRLNQTNLSSATYRVGAEPTPSPPSGLPTWAKVLIGVGVVAVVAGIVAGVLIWKRKKKKE